MKRSRKFDAGWAVWLCAGVALEAAALRSDDPRNPLSGQTRALCGVHPRRWWKPVGEGALLGISAWFWWHACRWIEKAVTS